MVFITKRNLGKFHHRCVLFLVLSTILGAVKAIVEEAVAMKEAAVKEEKEAIEMEGMDWGMRSRSSG
jgi:hypothetical protein